MNKIPQLHRVLRPPEACFQRERDQAHHGQEIETHHGAAGLPLEAKKNEPTSPQLPQDPDRAPEVRRVRLRPEILANPSSDVDIRPGEPLPNARQAPDRPDDDHHLRRRREVCGGRSPVPTSGARRARAPSETTSPERRPTRRARALSVTSGWSSARRRRGRIPARPAQL